MRAAAGSTAQEGAERDRSPQDWGQQAAAQGVEPGFPAGLHAAGPGGAREGCPWEVPHRGRRWQSASGAGVLGRGPGGGALGPQGKLPARGCLLGTRAWTPPVSPWRPLLEMPNVVPRHGVGNVLSLVSGRARWGFGAQRSSLERWKGCS